VQGLTGGLRGKLYVAYNGWGEQLSSMEDDFLPALKAALPAGDREIVTLWGPVEKAARAVAGHLKGWEDPVIICAQAGAFVGTWASTFTGYIQRLRGYMPLTADKRMLYHTGPPAWTSATAPHDRAD
jgi:hypothetical protein